MVFRMQGWRVLRNMLLVFFLVVIFLLIAAGLLFVGLDIAYANHVFKGVHVEGVYIGSMSQEEAIETLRNKLDLDTLNSDLVLEFDPVGDTWVEKALMPTGRYDFGAAEVKNGLIYAAGGEAGGPSNTGEAYDLTNDSWVQATSLSGARRGLAVAAVHKFVYAIGGWGILADGSEGPVGLVEAAKTPNINRLRR